MTWTIEPMPLRGPLFEGAIAVYGAAFSEPPYNDPDRGREVRGRLRDTHARRPHYRAFVAREPGGDVVGMIYGYRSSWGQWWHDTVRVALGWEEASRWLNDAYEIVEVAVAPRWQGRGIGEAMIASLLDGRPERTSVLSTRTDSRAHQLYRRLGFQVIRAMAFAPGGAEFYVMGRMMHQPDG